MNRLADVRIDAPWLTSPLLQKVFSILNRSEGEAMVVGGAVRNHLLGLAVDEVDLATNLVPKEVTQRLTDEGIQVIQTGAEHGTVTAVIEGQPYEITTLRADVETDGRHAVVRFGADWHEDALRRDFTMNALYGDFEGNIYDPISGYDDLQDRAIRFIGDPRVRIDEDALRILRFFRFLAWFGTGRPDADGLKACAAKRDLLDTLSRERKWQETRRLLAAPDPFRAILWMRTAGILSVVLPEGDKWGIDALPHLIGLEKELEIEPDPMRRLMAIMPPDADRMAALAKRMAMSSNERDRLTGWALCPDVSAMQDHELKALIYRGARQALEDRCLLALGLQSADESADVSRLKAMLKLIQTWQSPEFPVSGADLLAFGYEEGPQLGKQLKALESRWIENDFKPGKKALLKRVEPPKGV